MAVDRVSPDTAIGKARLRETMTDREREGLRAAIESLHGCKAIFRGSGVCAASGSSDHTREIATFASEAHTTAPLASSWSDVRADQIRHRVVLHTGGITSAVAAVRGFFLFHQDDDADPR